MTAPLQFTVTSASLQTMLTLRATSLTRAQVASLDPLVRAEIAAAAAMSDEDFWTWDRRYGTAVGLQAPTLVDLTEQGACGGGGCNPSYSNSQFWRANVACSADVYAKVLFQSVRYRAAQARLQRLLAAPPQAWPGRMFFADVQDADGCSTTLPQRPAGEQPLSTKANEWADWCMEVMRLVAVARWASGVRWSEATRGGAGGMGISAPAAAGGGYVNGMGDDALPRICTTPDSYGQWTMANTRPIALPEMGTVAGIVAANPTLVDATSTGSPQYLPDVALSYMASYHPIGYFRPTSPRGLGPARWTWGTNGWVAGLMRKTKAWRGLNEIGVSKLPEAAIFQRFRTTDARFPLVEYEYHGTDLPYYTGTWLQLSECLATRHGNASGPHQYVMPERKSDFDPIVTPELVHEGTHVIWPDDLSPPTDTSPRGILVHLFQQTTIGSPSGLIDVSTLSNLRAQWQLHWSSAAFRFMPAGLRQIWWCMALAHDVVDTSMGTAVGQAFQNFTTGLNQLPPQYRVLNPTEGASASAAAAAAAANLEAIFAGCSAAAGVIGGVASAAATAGPVGAVVGVVLGVVAALVALAGTLARNAISLGLARAGNPPVMPTIMHRVAGTASTSDPCWLVAPTDAGAGGAAALQPRAQAVQHAAETTQSPDQWYAQVQAAIEAGGPPPPTAATVNKGVALGAGAIAGLALIKLIGG